MATASSLFSCDSSSDDTDRDAVVAGEKLCQRDDDRNKVASSSKSSTRVSVPNYSKSAMISSWPWLLGKLQTPGTHYILLIVVRSSYNGINAV